MALMLDPRFRDLFILSNYVGIKKSKLHQITTRYDSKILIPLLCSTYQKVHPFAGHPSNFGPQEWPLVKFGARLTQDQIAMEHVSFWFLQSHVSF
jgi:hypothetical protein